MPIVLNKTEAFGVKLAKEAHASWWWRRWLWLLAGFVGITWGAWGLYTRVPRLAAALTTAELKKNAEPLLEFGRNDIYHYFILMAGFCLVAYTIVTWRGHPERRALLKLASVLMEDGRESGAA